MTSTPTDNYRLSADIFALKPPACSSQHMSEKYWQSLSLQTMGTKVPISSELLLQTRCASSLSQDQLASVLLLVKGYIFEKTSKRTFSLLHEIDVQELFP